MLTEGWVIAGLTEAVPRDSVVGIIKGSVRSPGKSTPCVGRHKIGVRGAVGLCSVRCPGAFGDLLRGAGGGG
jgi:hypothetical protein